jgi:WD40 repeat protein
VITSADAAGQEGGYIRVVTASYMHETIKVWDSEGVRLHDLRGHVSGIESLLVYKATPDMWLLLSAAQDHQLRLWDPEAGRCLYILQGHSQEVWRVLMFETDEGRRQLVSADSVGELIVWDFGLAPSSPIHIAPANKRG